MLATRPYFLWLACLLPVPSLRELLGWGAGPPGSLRLSGSSLWLWAQSSSLSGKWTVSSPVLRTCGQERGLTPWRPGDRRQLRWPSEGPRGPPGGGARSQLLPREHRGGRAEVHRTDLGWGSFKTPLSLDNVGRCWSGGGGRGAWPGFGWQSSASSPNPEQLLSHRTDKRPELLRGCPSTLVGSAFCQTTKEAQSAFVGHAQLRAGTRAHTHRAAPVWLTAGSCCCLSRPDPGSW